MKNEQPRIAILLGDPDDGKKLNDLIYTDPEKLQRLTLTLVSRNASKPNAVKELVANKNGNGDIALSWRKPMESADKDLTRGFRIIEKNGRLGSNRSVYVPVEAEKNNFK